MEQSFTFIQIQIIFTETTTFDDKILKNRIRELAFLNKGLELTFTDKRKETAETDVYKFEGGIKEYVAFLNEGKKYYLMNQFMLKVLITELTLKWLCNIQMDTRPH